MSQYITLLGAEEVSSAASRMTSAAQQMNSAAASIAWSLEQHQRFMDDWLVRMQDTLNAKHDGS